MLDEIYKTSQVPLAEKRRLGFKAVGITLIDGCPACAAKERFEWALATGGKTLNHPQQPKVQEVKRYLCATPEG